MRLRHAPNDYLQDAWSFVHVAFVVLEKVRPPICTLQRLSVCIYIYFTKNPINWLALRTGPCVFFAIKRIDMKILIGACPGRLQLH